jgi:hypothetical protein
MFHFFEWYASLGMLSGASPPELVSADTARRARRYLTEFIFSHAMAFHEQVLGRSEATENAIWIAGFILARSLKTISERDVYRNCPALKHKERRDAIEGVMRILELQDWVQISKWKGRPVQWSVNPAVHEMFAERAEQERIRRTSAQDSIRRAGAERCRSRDMPGGDTVGA